MSAVTFFFRGEGDRNDRQAGRSSGEDDAILDHSGRTFRAVRSEHDVRSAARRTDDPAQRTGRPSRRRAANRLDAVPGVQTHHEIAVPGPGGENDDRLPIPRMQHQQQMGVPEDDDVSRETLDVLDTDVADAERGAQQADELRAQEREEAVQARAPARSSARNCMSYNLR